MWRFKFAFVVLLTLAGALPLCAQDEQEDQRGAPAEPVDAADIRAQMAVAESLLGKTPDRAAILYFLAGSHAQLHEPLPALRLLTECIALREGFDPSGDPTFASLASSSDPEFKKLVEQVRKDFPPVHDSHLAFTADKDQFPEGLAYDPLTDTFLLGAMYHPKITRISLQGKKEDFVPAGRDHLLPLLGIRIDPTDNTVWAASEEEDSGKSELLHFDRGGVLLGRFTTTETGKHLFNDLVVLHSGEIFMTDTAANQVYRFDRKAGTFTPLNFSRKLLAPNGIALSSDEQALYVADNFGILRYDLKTGASVELAPPPRSTLAGADGLYFHSGSLIGVQNGIGTPRIALFRLSPDGLRVSKSIVLETPIPLPTTGAIRGDDFYYMANSQIDNLNGQHILDVTRMEPVRIAVIKLP